MRVQALENVSKVVLVFICTRTGDKEVINVGIAEIRATQDLVDEALKRLGCILESKGHPKELKQSKGCCDSSLGDIIRLGRDLMIRSD